MLEKAISRETVRVGHRFDDAFGECRSAQGSVRRTFAVHEATCAASSYS